MNWISVKDQMPPLDMERFLTISRFNDKVGISERRCWGDRNWLVGGLYLPKDIRYWMPLPDAPDTNAGHKTNADRIRSMSDEELAEEYTDRTYYCSPVLPRPSWNDPYGNATCIKEEALKEWLDWLKQPHKEDE